MANGSALPNAALDSLNQQYELLLERLYRHPAPLHGDALVKWQGHQAGLAAWVKADVNFRREPKVVEGFSLEAATVRNFASNGHQKILHFYLNTQEGKDWAKKYIKALEEHVKDEPYLFDRVKVKLDKDLIPLTQPLGRTAAEMEMPSSSSARSPDIAWLASQPSVVLMSEFSSLGSLLVITIDPGDTTSGASSSAPRSQALAMTIGGIIFVDEKPYGLTTGHGLFRKDQPFISGHGTSMEELRGRFPRKQGVRSVWGGFTTAAYPSDRPDAPGRRHPGHAADWALVELAFDNIPPSCIHRDLPHGRLLWPLDLHERAFGRPDTASSEKTEEHILQEILPLDSLIKLLTKDPRGSPVHSAPTSPRVTMTLGLRDVPPEPVRCLIVTPYGTVPGLITAMTAAVSFGDGASVSAFKIYTLEPLEPGNSGSWLVVENALCGVLTAGFGSRQNNRTAKGKDKTENGDDDDDDDDDNDYDGLPGGYMIPIETIFSSIASTLSAKSVRLPTMTDWRISSLVAERRQLQWAGRGGLPDWSYAAGNEASISHQPLLERLLAQREIESRKRAASLSPSSPSSTALRLSPRFDPALDLTWSGTRPIPIYPNFKVARRLEGKVPELGTLERLMILGVLFNVSPMLRSWLHSAIFEKQLAALHKHNRLRKLRAARPKVSTGAEFMIAHFICTHAGENLAALILLLSGSLGRLGHKEPWSTDDKELLEGGLAMLLVALFGILGVPAHSVPSTCQLRCFISCILAALYPNSIGERGIIVPLELVVPGLYGLDMRSGSLDVPRESPVADTARILEMLYRARNGGADGMLVAAGRNSNLASLFAVCLGLHVEVRDLPPRVDDPPIRATLRADATLPRRNFTSLSESMQVQVEEARRANLEVLGRGGGREVQKGPDILLYLQETGPLICEMISRNEADFHTGQRFYNEWGRARGPETEAPRMMVAEAMIASRPGSVSKGKERAADPGGTSRRRTLFRARRRVQRPAAEDLEMV